MGIWPELVDDDAMRFEFPSASSKPVRGSIFKSLEWLFIACETRLLIYSHCTRHETAWHGRLQRHQTGCYTVQSSISFVCELNSMPFAIEPRLSIINCSLFELQGCIVMIKCRQCQPVIGLEVFACDPEGKAESCYSLITHH
jgi:hypothetical protein